MGPIVAMVLEIMVIKTISIKVVNVEDNGRRGHRHGSYRSRNNSKNYTALELLKDLLSKKFRKQNIIVNLIKRTVKKWVWKKILENWKIELNFKSRSFLMTL